MYPYSGHYAYHPIQQPPQQPQLQPQLQPQQQVYHYAQQHYVHAQQQQQQQVPMSYVPWQQQPVPVQAPSYLHTAQASHPIYQVFQPPASNGPPPPQPQAVRRISVPPPTYICHRCKQRGHWITDCPAQPNQSTQQQSSPPVPTAKPTAPSTRVQPTPPTITTFFCEPCEKEFTSANKYQAHRSSHEQCRASGCSFEGSKKVVIAHYHAVHGKFKGSGYKMIDVEGQKFRVLLGTTPDEVKEWREQRRKKFPTKENVEQQEAGRQALVDAGGVLPPVKGRKRKLPHSGAAVAENGQPNTATKVDNVEAAAKRPAIANTNHTESSANYDATTSSQSLAALSTYADASEGEEGEVQNEAVDTMAALTNGEGREELLQQGASIEQATESTSSLSSKSKDEQQRKRRPCTYYLRGHCNKGEDCPFNHDVERKICKYFSQGHCRKGKRCPFMHERGSGENEEKRVKKSMGLNLPLPMRNSKLLNALVKDQVVEEENVLLQCLHYIVQRDFMNAVLPQADIEKLSEQAAAEEQVAAEKEKERVAKNTSAKQTLLTDDVDPSLLAQLDPEVARELEQSSSFDGKADDGGSSTNITPTKNVNPSTAASDNELEDGEVSESSSDALDDDDKYEDEDS